MPAPFPLTPVAATGDPFCTDPFCDDVSTTDISITPPSGTPVVNNTLTAGSTGEGGVINWYRLDPSAPGGKVFLATGATLQVAMANLGYAINYELTFPGFPPILSDPTAPVEEWNTFTAGGEFVTYRRVNQDFTAFYTCAGVIIQDATSTVNGPFFHAARNNVVGYQLGGNTSVITYVCPPTPVDTNEVSMGISVLYANNSSEFIGTYLPNGNRGGQTGTRMEVWTFTSITVGGIQIYP